MEKLELEEIKKELEETRSKLRNAIRYVDNITDKSLMEEIDYDISEAICGIRKVLKNITYTS